MSNSTFSGAAARTTVFVGFSLLMVLPLASLILYSVAEQFSTTAAFPVAYGGRWFREFFANPRANGALLNSLAIALCSTGLSLLIGLPAAWAVARRPIARRELVAGAVLLRTAVPVIVLAVGTAALLFRVGAIDRWWSVLLAHTAGCLPFVVWTARPAFERLLPELGDAARDLGLGIWRRSWLAIREAAPGITAGALFAFLFSMDEFALTFLIAGVDVVTLPVLLYDSLQRSSVQAASAVAVVLLFPSVIVAGLSVWVMRRSEQSLLGR